MNISKLEILYNYKDLNDPRDIPIEIKNFSLLINKCDYILEKLNIVKHDVDNDIWYLCDEEINENELLLKNLTSLLNKLTDDNFNTLFIEITNFEKINNHEILNKAIDRLINNIKFNQVFCNTYSKLCYNIDNKDLWGYTDDNNNNISFKNMILQKLQNEFFNIFNTKSRKKELDLLNSIDCDDERYDEECELKNNKNGIILLLSYFYNRNLIDNRIMEEVIRYLISPLYDNINIPDEWNLEFLYNLFNISFNKLNQNKFWGKSFSFDIKYSLKYLIKDDRIKPRFKLIFEDYVKQL